MIKRIKTDNRAAWKALRHKYIGGSDAAAIVGMNDFSSPYAVWAEKLDKVPPFEGNLSTEVGAYLEEFVARKFEAETGKAVRKANQSFINDEYPWAIANIDRSIVGEDAGLEIKTTGEMNLKKFKGGEYPANYYCQCVHYMAVTWKAKWYLAVLIGNRDFRIFEIERDESEIKALMDAEKDFYYNYMLPGNPPPADGSRATTETIKEQYPDSSDVTVDLFGMDGRIEQYFALASRIKELQSEQDEIANSIKSIMGESSKAECGKYKVSWSSSTRSSFDSKKFAADHQYMDLSAYYKTTQLRTFRINEIKGA